MGRPSADTQTERYAALSPATLSRCGSFELGAINHWLQNQNGFKWTGEPVKLRVSPKLKYTIEQICRSAFLGTAHLVGSYVKCSALRSFGRLHLDENLFAGTVKRPDILAGTGPQRLQFVMRCGLETSLLILARKDRASVTSDVPSAGPYTKN